MKYLLIFAVLFCEFIEANSQELKKIVVKNKDPFSIEEYHVLKSDKSIKHGEYIRKREKNKISEKGYYKNNLMDSTWIYYFGNGIDTSVIKHFKNNEPIGQIISYKSKNKIEYIYDCSKNDVIKYNWYDASNVFPILVDGKWVNDSVDSPPLIISGGNLLAKRVHDTIRYPDIASDAGITGDVSVSFVVDKDGSMGQIRLKTSVHPYLDAEALRVISSLTDLKWFPARKNGKSITIEYFLMLKFHME